MQFDNPKFLHAVMPEVHRRWRWIGVFLLCAALGGCDGAPAGEGGASARDTFDDDDFPIGRSLDLEPDEEFLDEDEALDEDEERDDADTLRLRAGAPAFPCRVRE